MRLTLALSTETALTLESERSLPSGSVEVVYACACRQGDHDALHAAAL